jgi:hypothetical protein
MRQSLLRVASVLAVLAMLFTAREARAQQRAEDFTFFAIAVIPPAAMSLIFDLAMLGSLASDGTVRRGFAVNGLVFSLVNGLFSAVTLLSAQGNPTGMRYTIPFCWASLALSGASSAVAIYSFGHAPKPAPVEREREEAQAQAPTLELIPSLGLTPAGSPTGGASVSLRW